jgi:hypothetical protein
MEYHVQMGADAQRSPVAHGLRALLTPDSLPVNGAVSRFFGRFLEDSQQGVTEQSAQPGREKGVRNLSLAKKGS